MGSVPGVAAMMHAHGIAGWWVLMPLSMLSLWGLAVAGVAWAVRRLVRPDRSRDEALETARQRYARGELDREEFEQLRDDLNSATRRRA
jgi:putative membrane protein